MNSGTSERQNRAKILPGNILISSIVTVAILVTLTASLFRVITNAQENYEVYMYEKQALEVLRQENIRLQSELEYYQSNDYKKLYARDYLRLAEPGERLYQVLGDKEYYSIAQAKLDIFNPETTAEWWWLLLK